MQGSTAPKDLYKIKTIAAMTGFNPTLLRAWERRYDLLVPTRTPTGHRLYTPDDLRVLRRVKAMIDQGRSIGEIVAQGRQRLLSMGQAPGSTPARLPESWPERGNQNEFAKLREEILQAALELDDAAIQIALDRAFATVSATQVIENLLVPLAHEMGRLWANQIASVASEHLLTSCMQRRLQRLIDIDTRSGRCRAICCGFPDEFHELGILTLTYSLHLQGVRVVYLGAALPFDDLARAIQIRQPHWVLLSVMRVALLEVHKPALLQMIHSLSVPVRFGLGGGAIRPADHPDLEAAGVTLWPPESSLSQLSPVLNVQAY